MIYTVTLNPSVDLVVRLPHLELGAVNRTESDDKFPGGKGINVSRILKRMQIDSIALGFLGGFTGDFIRSRLEQEQIKTNFTAISEETRINVKLKSDRETDINGAGPELSKNELSEFINQFNRLTEADIVVLSGSAPKCLGNRFYETLIEAIKEKGAEFIIDIEGETLIRALPHNPLLIKPNRQELSAIYRTPLLSKEEIVPYAKKLRDAGAKNAIVSMAGDGALLLTTGGIYFAPPVRGTVKNSVGAGDSMIAGFVGHFHKTRDAVEAFRWGVACGTATAFSDDLAPGAFILELLKQVKINRLYE